MDPEEEEAERREQIQKQFEQAREQVDADPLQKGRPQNRSGPTTERDLRNLENWRRKRITKQWSLDRARENLAERFPPKEGRSYRTDLAVVERVKPETPVAPVEPAHPGAVRLEDGNYYPKGTVRLEDGNYYASGTSLKPDGQFYKDARPLLQQAEPNVEGAFQAEEGNWYRPNHGKYYRDVTDLDMAVVDAPTQTGQMHRLEGTLQVKSGVGDKPAEAAAQSEKGRRAFEAIEAERSQARLQGRSEELPFELVRGDRRNIPVTHEFDLAGAVSKEAHSQIGPLPPPRANAFAESLPLTAGDIKNAAVAADVEAPLFCRLSDRPTGGAGGGGTGTQAPVPASAASTEAALENGASRFSQLKNVAGKGLGVLGVVGGGLQAYGGVNELAEGKTVEGSANVAGGGLNMAAGAAGLAGRFALGGGLGGAAALIDGGKDIYTGIRDHNAEKIGVGGVKSLAGGAMLLGVATGNPVLVVGGGLTYAGAALYENRKAIKNFAASTGRRAWAGAKSAARNVGETAHRTWNGAAHLAGRAANGASHAYHAVRDGAGRVIHNVAGGVSRTAHRAWNGAAHAARSAGQAAGRVWHGAGQVVHNVASGAGRALHNAASAGGQAVRHVADGAGRVLGRVGGAVNNVAAAAAAGVTNTAGRAWNAVSDWWHGK